MLVDNAGELRTVRRVPLDLCAKLGHVLDQHVDTDDNANDDARDGSFNQIRLVVTVTVLFRCSALNARVEVRVEYVTVFSGMGCGIGTSRGTVAAGFLLTLPLPALNMNSGGVAAGS